MNYEEFSNEQNQKLNDLYATFDQESFDKETIKTQIKTIVDAQAQYGKDQYLKKQNQINSLFGDVGYDPESGVPFKEYVNSLKTKTEQLSTTENEYQSMKQSYNAMEERLKRIEAEREAEREKAEKLKRDNERATISKKLSDSLDDKFNPKVRDMIIEKELAKFKLVDGEVMGVNGEDVSLFDNALENLIKEYEDLIVNNQKAGVQSAKPVTGRPNSGGDLTLEQINKMSPAELKANMAKIRQQGKNSLRR